ncbi:MAG: hypothetical protein D6824_06300 [Planctomycetota bacterium]|nr:MAG: hypothetical protein D6824_06300 [Planctomycetota bacterium]
MRIGVPRQTQRGETRVALTPESVSKLTQRGVEVAVQRGAGEKACFTDEAGGQDVRHAA